MKSFICLISSLVFAALPASALGFSNFNNYQSARVLDKGQVSIGFGTGILHSEGEGGYSNVYFVPDVWAHFGVRDGLQIGVRAAPIAAGIDIKTRIFSNEKTSLSLAPYVGISYGSYDVNGFLSMNMFGITTALSLILGTKVGERSEFVMSAKLLYDIYFTHEKMSLSEFGSESFNGQEEIVTIGGSFGFIVGSGDLSVIPEIGVYNAVNHSKFDGESSQYKQTMIFPGFGISIIL